MKMQVTRRDFLKGSAALAAAVAASGLLGGCSGGVDSGYTLGEYKVYFEKGGYSWGGKNGEETGYVYPTVKVKGISNGVAGKFLKDVFSATADGQELELKNRSAQLAVVQNLTSEALPQFTVEDEALYKKLVSGETKLDLSVTLSAQTMVFAVNIKTGAVSVKKGATAATTD